MFSENKRVNHAVPNDQQRYSLRHRRACQEQAWPDVRHDQLGPELSFDSPLLVPFAAGVLQGQGDETRINSDAVVEGDLLQIFDELDARFEQELAPLSSKSAYHPLVTRSEHGARIRMKVNTQGPQKAMLYNMQKERLGGIRDVETAGAYVIPVVAVPKDLSLIHI